MTDEPTIVYGDNNAANLLTKEDMVSAGNKYFYLAYHWSKSLVDTGIIDVRYKDTVWNIADIFTKPVNVATSRRLVGRLTGYTDFRNESDPSITKKVKKRSAELGPAGL